MRQSTRISVMAIVLLLTVAVAPTARVVADWNYGDPYKMHFPQLPNPLGWDVAVTTASPPPPAAVADDWLCTQTGPVSDIHIWFSMQGDLPPVPSLMAFTIWSDVPDPDGYGPAYSMPGNLLWNRTLSPGQFTIRPYGTGPQGWYDPAKEIVAPNDHFNIWQLNLTITDQDVFVQQAGHIYWLGVNFEPTWGNSGWKTSLNHFNDDAVWWNFASQTWMELRDPITQESLDMAFVITPEPATLSLLALGGLAVLRRRKVVVS